MLVLVTLVILHKTTKGKIGAGVTYHINPNFTHQSNNNEARVNYQFKNSLGYMVEYIFPAKQGKTSLGFRANFINYRNQYNTSKVENANNIGLFLTFPY